MRIAKYLTTTLIATLVLSTSLVQAEEKVYRWVDENGVVHFGSRPEANTGAELIKLQKTPQQTSTEAGVDPAFPVDTGPSYAQKLRDERAKKREETTRKRAEVEQECNRHKDLIAKLEPKPRVIIQKEDGTVERMDDNDRLERVRESKDFIARNCRN